MILLPSHLLKQYRSFCATNGAGDGVFADYLKWLRYFLDFCEKYQVAGYEVERLRLFLDKLRQKGQSEEKRQQASHAVSLYFAMIRSGTESRSPVQIAPAEQLKSRQSEMAIQVQPNNNSRRQMKRVSDLHAKDLKEGYDGVFLCGR